MATGRSAWRLLCILYHALGAHAHSTGCPRPLPWNYLPSGAAGLQGQRPCPFLVECNCLAESQPGHIQYSVKICRINDILSKAELQIQIPAKQQAKPPSYVLVHGGGLASQILSWELLCLIWPHMQTSDSGWQNDFLGLFQLLNSSTCQKVNSVTWFLCSSRLWELQRSWTWSYQHSCLSQANCWFYFLGASNTELGRPCIQHAVFPSPGWDCGVSSAGNPCAPHPAPNSFPAWLTQPTHLQSFKSGLPPSGSLSSSIHPDDLVTWLSPMCSYRTLKLQLPERDATVPWLTCVACGTKGRGKGSGPCRPVIAPSGTSCVALGATFPLPGACL